MNKTSINNEISNAPRKEYDTLHTESRENVTSDIIDTLAYWEEKKGIKS